MRQSCYPPQDCRSRGDCGSLVSESVAEHTKAASRLPQSRRLRPSSPEAVYKPRCCAASRLPQSRRLRPVQAPTPLPMADDRLKIAAVAATAATMRARSLDSSQAASRLPQSRRLRPGLVRCDPAKLRTASRLPQSRRLRPRSPVPELTANLPASRLPQSRRLRRPKWPAPLANGFLPPQDCRSRGDCGIISA